LYENDQFRNYQLKILPNQAIHFNRYLAASAGI